MKAWPSSSLSALPGRGHPVRVRDTATGDLVPVGPGGTTGPLGGAAPDGGPPSTAGSRVGLYVCGVTPYDAAHLGHAHTYVAFDVLRRALLDAGHRVRHVQNVTDVDDPLLERARDTGEPWQDLADRQSTVFADQMAALAVLPPDVYLAVSEVVEPVGEIVRRLVDAGAAYPVPGPGPAPDLYFDVTVDDRFGSVGRLAPPAMAELFAERGGDPDRPGKRHPLDPLLWRAARDGEPSWSVPGLPPGRPGWHVECVAIALDHLGTGFDVQGGGSDLVFPHHEMGASHARALTGEPTYARAYVHAGMVGLGGKKMSKSRGNLVFVHEAVAGGLEPSALRVALLDHHYRADWSWTDDAGAGATKRVDRWREAVSREAGPSPDAALDGVRRAVADDLDTPAALAAVDAWADAQLAVGGEDPAGPGVVSRALDTVLGVRL